MISKVSAVSNGINTLRYIDGESEKKKHPEKIYHICNQFLSSDMDAMGMWTMMNFRTMDHPEMKKNVLNIKISPAKSNTDYFAQADWQQLWKDFVEEFDKQEFRDKNGKVYSGRTNLAGSMATVWLHRDSKSGIPHLHAVVCRVDEQGHTNNDHKIDVRARRAAEAVAIKYGWLTAREVRDRNMDRAAADCMEALKSMSYWSWTEYVIALQAKGYRVKLTLDGDNVVRNYTLHRGKAKYKASDLGRGRKLTARNIEATWNLLHPREERRGNSVSPVTQKNDFKPTPSIPTNRQRMVVNEYKEWKPDYQKVNIDYGGEPHTRYIPREVAKEFDDQFDYRIVLNWQALTNLAMAYFVMLTIPDVMPGSGGGGSTSSEGWGRKPDDDDMKWARRCAKAAMMTLGRIPRRGLHR